VTAYDVTGRMFGEPAAATDGRSGIESARPPRVATMLFQEAACTG
jgi:hypothetical protein